jgi:hypothetical protein
MLTYSPRKEGLLESLLILPRQVFCQDLKIAHYMKIPPRVTFMSQAVAAVWACFVQIAVMNWTLGNIEDVCAS